MRVTTVAGLLVAVVPIWASACASSRSGEEPAPRIQTEVGLAATDSAHLTRSGATVRSDDEDAPNFRSFAEMLGRVPGVQVSERSDGTLRVRIRGATSFSSSEEPLFILDGMAVPSVSGLNPNAIASITVLKEAAETAIYGARGANGVIVIRTKR